MRTFIYSVIAIALVLVIAAGHMLSSADAAAGMREGQEISIADAGSYNDDTYSQVSDWLGELE